MCGCRGKRVLLMQIIDQLTVTPGNKSVFMADFREMHASQPASQQFGLILAQFVHSFDQDLFLCFTYHLHWQYLHRNFMIHIYLFNFY